MDFSKETIKKIRGLLVFTILAVTVIWNYEMLFSALAFTGSVLLPFAIGGAIAFILNVPMKFTEEKLFTERKIGKAKFGRKAARPLSFLLTVLFVFALFAVIILVVLPELGRTVMNVGKMLQELTPQLERWAVKFFGNNQELLRLIEKFKWEEIFADLIRFFKSGAGDMLGTTLEAVKNLVSGVSTFLIAFVFACYILFEKEQLKIQVRKMMYAFLPDRCTEAFMELGSVTYKTFSNFLTGQCLEAVILGLMFLVTMTVFQMPYALLVAVLIGFTALIPVFGAFIGCAAGTLLIFMVNPMQAAEFIVLFLILQQIEGNFIYPHVVGNSVGLPAMWVLMAVSLGSSLMGIIGMLIFIPIVSVIYTLLKRSVNRRLKKKNIAPEDLIF